MLIPLRFGVSRALRVATIAASLAFALGGTGCAAVMYSDGQQQFARMYSGPIPITMVNDTGQDACYVRLSPSVADSMGDDWLGSTEIVGPGMSRMFNVAARGPWNIRIENCNHAAITERLDVPIPGPTRIMMSTLQPVSDVASAGGEAPPMPWTPPAVSTTTLPPISVTNVSTEVVVTNTPAPEAGSDDVITLRDGTLLRGHVAELRPGQRLTIVLLTGEARALNWGDVASETGPSFRALGTAAP